MIYRKVKPYVLHSHFCKSMVNPLVIRSDSAESITAKINIPKADLVRVVRNVFPYYANLNSNTSSTKFSGCNVPVTHSTIESECTNEQKPRLGRILRDDENGISSILITLRVLE